MVDQLLKDSLKTLKSSIEEISCEDIDVEDSSGETLIDVRSTKEIAAGIIPGALPIGRDFLETNIGSEVPNLHQKITVYCGAGVRSLFAAQTLTQMGYTDVKSLRGGYDRWRELGRPIQRQEEPDFDAARYAKQIILKEIGEAGQRALSKSKVLLVGIGGLGSPSLAYLTGAGIGHLGLIDHDRVELSNLQRQIIHRNYERDMTKVSSGARFVRELNPDCQTTSYEYRLDKKNSAEIIDQYDLVINGTDNFATRYLINEVCQSMEKPFIHGAVRGFYGELAFFSGKRADPCYACLHPEAPPPELAPSCNDAGVVGAIPGIIGSLQALQAIKYIAGVSVANDELQLFDGKNLSMRTIKLAKDKECPVCGSGT